MHVPQFFYCDAYRWTQKLKPDSDQRINTNEQLAYGKCSRRHSHWTSYSFVYSVWSELYMRKINNPRFHVLSYLHTRLLCEASHSFLFFPLLKNLRTLDRPFRGIILGNPFRQTWNLFYSRSYFKTYFRLLTCVMSNEFRKFSFTRVYVYLFIFYLYVLNFTFCLSRFIMIVFIFFLNILFVERICTIFLLF